MNLHNQDYIEAYITDKLSASEKALFEAELSKDPLLQNEVSLQKEIVDCLGNFRKAEIKSRLNNIDVGLNTSVSSGLKFAASVVIGSIVLGTGVFVYFNNKTNTELANSQNPYSVESTINEPATQTINNTEIVAAEGIITNEEQNATGLETNKNIRENITTSQVHIDSKESSLESPTKNQVSKSSKSNRKHSQSVALNEKGTDAITKTFGAPNLNSPDVKEYFDDTEKITEGNINVPTGTIAQSTDTKLQNLNISINDKEKKDFHYKYFNNKLFLYGDFNAKPYQLLELNNKHNKQLYLNFEDKYYLLKQNQLEKAPLKDITDKDLIKQLEIINNK